MHHYGVMVLYIIKLPLSFESHKSYNKRGKKAPKIRRKTDFHKTYIHIVWAYNFPMASIAAQKRNHRFWLHTNNILSENGLSMKWHTHIYMYSYTHSCSHTITKFKHALWGRAIINSYYLQFDFITFSGIEFYLMNCLDNFTFFVLLHLPGLFFHSKRTAILLSLSLTEYYNISTFLKCSTKSFSRLDFVGCFHFVQKTTSTAIKKSTQMLLY